MVELKAISYEESRMEYFRKQRDSAKRRMNYWCGAKQADRVGWMEASDRASEASAQYNFYKDTLEALAAHPKWISVEDRLPEDNLNVLVYAIGNNKNSVIAMTGYTHKMYGYNIDGWRSPWQYFFYEYKITHWMPLPEAPKEDVKK